MTVCWNERRGLGGGHTMGWGGGACDAAARHHIWTLLVSKKALNRKPCLNSLNAKREGF